MERPLYLTSDGKEILRKGLLGKEIRFSKVAFGAGDFDYETEKVADLTELRDWRMDLPIVDKVLEGGMVQIIAELKNFELETGFPAKEIGIYAIDPDNGKEKLYAYRNCGEEYNFIPGGNGIVKKNARFGYWIEIDDAPNVTFNIDYSFAHVTKQEFEEHLNSKNPHPNTPTLLNEVDTTEIFWATDFDKNLHPISVENSKKVLLADLEKNFDGERNLRRNLQEFIEAKIISGVLEPNILICENFAPPTSLDTTKIKITSCAAGGNFLSAKMINGLKIGAEYFLTDGANCEQVKIADIVISNSSVMINNSTYVVTLENNLANNYNLSQTFLMRTTATIENNSAKCSAPKQVRKWKSRETFKGYPSNAARDVILDFSCDNFAAFKTDGDAFFEGGNFAL